MASETDLDKEIFVEFHGELAWNRLVKPRLENKEFVAYLASVSPTATIEGWVHRYVVSPMLFLMGHTGAHGGLYDCSLRNLKKQEPPKRVIYVNDDGDYTLYDATGAEKLTEMALAILKTRSKWYRWKHEGDEIKDPEKPTMSKEEIGKLREGPVKKAATDEWINYETEVKRRKRNRQENAALERAFKDKNGKLAMEILESHNEYGSSRDSVRLTEIKQEPPKE